MTGQPSIEEIFTALSVAARRAPTLEEHHRLIDVMRWIVDEIGVEVDHRACDFAAEWEIVAGTGHG